MTTDLLERRLRSMSIPAPDPGRISARATAAQPRGGRRVSLRVAAAPVAAAALLIALTLYFVPALDTAVAGVPVAGDLLRDAGLAGVRDRITSVGAAATSSGYTIQLVGAYADSARVALILHSDPPADPVLSGVLTDQFGRTYDSRFGTADLQTGDSVIEFEPLAWPDGFTGARIHLHISELRINEMAGPGQGIKGSWDLQATLGVDEGTSLALPADATLGRAHFHFTSVSYTPATISVRVDETGVSAEELARIIPDGGKGYPAFQMQVFAPDGQEITGNASSSDDMFGVVHIELNGFRTGGGGKYVIRFSLAGAGSFDRVLPVT